MELPILTDNAEHGKGQEGVRGLREKEIDNVNLGKLNSRINLHESHGRL